MARWVGIDYGLKRIGLAISDAGELLASPLETLVAGRTAAMNAALVSEWGTKREAAGFVVGLPLNMDGSDSEQTRYSRIFSAALESAAGLPVQLWDERLSSFQADRIMDQAQVRPRKRRQLRDALAAACMLQAFLDARRRPPSEPGCLQPDTSSPGREHDSCQGL